MSAAVQHPACPILLIEILSPANRAETRSNVWTHTTIASVREILVIHSERVAADVLRRLADGSWPARPEAVGEGNLILDSIGFVAPLIDIYRTTRLAAPLASG